MSEQEVEALLDVLGELLKELFLIRKVLAASALGQMGLGIPATVESLQDLFEAK